MKTQKLVMLIIGIVLVSGAITLFTSMLAPDRTESAVSSRDSSAPKEGFCPDCGKELPARIIDGCPFCKAQKDAAAKKGGSGPRGRKLTGSEYFILGMVLFLLLGGGFLILRSVKFPFRRRANQPKFYSRCPKCKRRLRYSQRQAGKEGLCPSCRYTMTLPIPSKNR
jgi:hypothetical protein